MSVKLLCITELGYTIVIAPMAHWWKPLHLQYYKLGVCGDIPGKNHKRRTMEVRFKNTPAITACCHKCLQRERNGDLVDGNFKF